MAPPLPPARPFIELRDSGLLWLINRVAFHPRGVALALSADEAGDVYGWSLLPSPDGGPWTYPPDTEPGHYQRAETTLADTLAARPCPATALDPFHGLAHCEQHPLEEDGYQHEGTSQDGSRIRWSDGEPGTVAHGADGTEDTRDPAVHPDEDTRPPRRTPPDGYGGRPGRTPALDTRPPRPTSADAIRPGEDGRPAERPDAGRTAVRRAEIRQAIDGAFLAPDADGRPDRITPAGELTLGPDGLTDAERQRTTIRDTMKDELSHADEAAMWDLALAISRALHAMPRYAAPAPAGILGGDPADGPSLTTGAGPRCVCGDPLKWYVAPNGGAGWIHGDPTPGKPILDAHRPRPAAAEEPPHLQCVEQLAAVRDVITDMEATTGARHWALILRKAAGPSDPDNANTRHLMSTSDALARARCLITAVSDFACQDEEEPGARSDDYRQALAELRVILTAFGYLDGNAAVGAELVHRRANPQVKVFVEVDDIPIPIVHARPPKEGRTS